MNDDIDATIPLPLPQEGGSYIRQPDGSLIRNEEPAAVESPATDDDQVMTLVANYKMNQ